MEKLSEIRQFLHQHPEIAKHECDTQGFLLEKLKKLNPDFLTTIAGTGILTGFQGRKRGKNILVRADMDALPIQEINDFPYRSSTEGVSHKCGHDGHSTILYGVARYFSENEAEKGNIYLLFQPAEENGWGAQAVMESKKLDELRIDFVIALHNLPGFPLHQIICKTGNFTSGVVSLSADFSGYTAHAAEPWNGRNPAAAMSHFLLRALDLNMEQKSGQEYLTITPVFSQLGSRDYGISAGYGTVHLTVRADSNDRLRQVLEQLKSQAKNLAETDGLKVKFSLIEPFEANKNHPEAVHLIKSSAEALGISYYETKEPFRWGEDFGVITQNYKGAMFGLGSGKDCKPLHHPAYDFPDEIIGTGIRMFVSVFQKAQLL